MARIEVPASFSLTLPLPYCFGDGRPGWLARDVPEGTEIDFVEGRALGPAGKLTRSPATGLWARTH